MGTKSTPRVGLTYPTESTPTWFGTFENLMLQMDASIYAAREDRNTILVGGGVVTWSTVAGTLSFSEDVKLFSPATGAFGTISAGAYAIGDGEVLYVSTNRYPTASYTFTVQAAAQVPNDDTSIVFAYRYGDVIWIRGVGVLSDFYARPLAQEGLSDFPDPGSGGTVSCNSAPFSKNIRMTIGAGAETMNVTDPIFPGQELLLFAETVDSGSRTVTFASALNGSGNTHAAFNAANDTLHLRSFQLSATNFRWRALLNNSVTIS